MRQDEEVRRRDGKAEDEHTYLFIILFVAALHRIPSHHENKQWDDMMRHQRPRRIA